jgi:hypothetical protein
MSKTLEHITLDDLAIPAGDGMYHTIRNPLSNAGFCINNQRVFFTIRRKSDPLDFWNGSKVGGWQVKTPHSYSHSTFEDLVWFDTPEEAQSFIEQQEEALREDMEPYAFIPRANEERDHTSILEEQS